MDASFVYEQPLFFNPKILENGNPIFMHSFVKAGITKVKHLTLEVVLKFLSPIAVAEMVIEVNPDISIEA